MIQVYAVEYMHHNCIPMIEGSNYFRSSGVARGIIKNWCPRNAQICNRIDKLERSFEIASTTAFFCLERCVSLYPKGGFPSM